MVDATRFFWGAWLRAGEGIGWLAAGTMPNSLYRMPLVYLFLTCVFCYSCSFLFVVFCVFVFFFCSHWSLVDVPLIFFCPADHVPHWQPRVLLGMVEARSVNVKKTTTTTRYVVANPVRGLLDRKRSEEHLPSSNESKRKTRTHKNDKEKGTGITKYTGQKKIDEGHSIERVWYSASREPSDTLPGSQPCTQKRVASTTFRTLRASVFTNGTIDVA